MARINEVFGIQAQVPIHTYVDRAGLDARFRLLLDANQHLVIHGTSKQGKTVLRRRWIPEHQTVAVSCLSDMTLEALFAEILRKLGSTRVTSLSAADTETAERSSELSLGGPLGTQNLGMKYGAKRGKATTYTSVGTPLGNDVSSVGYVADEIKKSKRRLVIEDFHYLPEKEKNRLAKALKAFWDESVFVVIIGIWPEHNLLTYYANDLGGRVEEIDVEWTSSELEQVIEKGQKALNIFIPKNLVDTMVSDANKNVGLLQRQAQRYCYECGVIKTAETQRLVNDPEALRRCQKTICEGQATRYLTFCDAIRRGFKKSNGHAYYELILRTCIEATSNELLKGLHKDTIIQRVRQFDQTANAEGIGKSLKKLNSLQMAQQISPLILSYNDEAKTVQLIDREFLFYRKYGAPKWPWVATPTKSQHLRPADFPVRPPVPTARELRDVIAYYLPRLSRDAIVRRLIVEYRVSLDEAKAAVQRFMHDENTLFSNESSKRRTSLPPRPNRDDPRATS